MTNDQGRTHVAVAATPVVEPARFRGTEGAGERLLHERPPMLTALRRSFPVSCRPT
jgi:hypothetical protein